MRHPHLAALLAAAGLAASAAGLAATLFNFSDSRGSPVVLGTENGRVVQRMADGSVRPAGDGRYRAANGQVLEVKNGMAVGSFSWGALPGSSQAQDIHFRGAPVSPGTAQGFNPQPEPPGDVLLKKGSTAAKK